MNPFRMALPLSQLAVACTLVLGLQGCVIRTERPSLLAPARVPSQSKESPYLKAHLKSGEVYVLDSWRMGPDNTQLEGTGTRFTVLREPAGAGTQSIPLDAIALLETNAPERVVSLAAGVLSGLTVVMGTITAACVLDPKSCFGSCPTFYIAS
jgi:hypothetical protein